MKRKILFVGFFLFLFLFFAMIFSHNYFENKIIDEIYNRYAGDLLNHEFSMIESLIDRRISASNVISKMQIFYGDIENKEKVSNSLIENGFYSEVYVFDNDGAMTYSSEKINAINYAEFLDYVGDELTSGVLYFSEKNNAFYSMDGYLGNDSSGIFAWKMDMEVIEEIFSIPSEVGELYMIRYDNKVMIPVNFSGELEFDYESCISGEKFKESYISYRNLTTPNGCYFVSIFHSKEKDFNNFNNSLIACVVGFFILIIFYIVGGDFFNEK